MEEYERVRFYCDVVIHLLEAGYHKLEDNKHIPDWIVCFFHPHLRYFRDYYNIKTSCEDMSFTDEFLINPQFRQEITLTMMKYIARYCVKNNVVDRSQISNWEDNFLYIRDALLEKQGELTDDRIEEIDLPQFMQKIEAGIDFAKIKLSDDDAKTLILRPAQIKSINNALNKEFKNRQINIIVDANACSGADTFNFYNVFKDANIISIEKNPKRCHVLKRNVERFIGDKKNRINVICGSAVDEIDKMTEKVDIIYYDPPWNEKEDFLYLDGIEISDIIRNNFSLNKTDDVILKVPNGFNLEVFKAKIPTIKVYDIKDEYLKKTAYKLIFIKPPKLEWFEEGLTEEQTGEIMNIAIDIFQIDNIEAILDNKSDRKYLMSRAKVVYNDTFTDEIYRYIEGPYLSISPSANFLLKVIKEKVMYKGEAFYLKISGISNEIARNEYEFSTIEKKDKLPYRNNFNTIEISFILSFYGKDAFELLDKIESLTTRIILREFNFDDFDELTLNWIRFFIFKSYGVEVQKGIFFKQKDIEKIMKANDFKIIKKWFDGFSYTHVYQRLSL